MVSRGHCFFLWFHRPKSSQTIDRHDQGLSAYTCHLRLNIFGSNCTLLQAQRSCAPSNNVRQESVPRFYTELAVVWVVNIIHITTNLLVYVYMHVCMHACMYVCMIVCLFVCLLVCIYVLRSSAMWKCKEHKLWKHVDSSCKFDQRINKWQPHIASSASDGRQQLLRQHSCVCMGVYVYI